MRTISSFLREMWTDGFRQKVEETTEGGFGLVVNRDKTRRVDMKAPHESLAFLGYEFRFCRSRGGFRYLRYGPSEKSIRKVCAKIKEQTRSGRGLVPVDKTIDAVNRIIDGWGRHFRYGSPAETFGKVECVQLGTYIWLNRRSRRGYKLKYATTCYGELKHMGLIPLTCKRYRQ